MPATAAWFAPDLNVRDPEQNLYIGFGYLAMLIERYQDELTALVAYNVGPTRVDRHGIRPYTGSVGYANRILGGA
jgi:soluble lytic murein transglycosylase-like protein